MMSAPPTRAVPYSVSRFQRGVIWYSSRNAAAFSFRSGRAPRRFLTAGQPVTADLVWRAFLYAGITTGLAEELLFRRLISGALFRRLRFWTANGIQAGIFTALHALLLLVAPKLWPLLFVILALALVLGWLRHRSGSIGPPWLVHASGNFIGALAVTGGFSPVT
jgi:membrane protease YdiL (CAAX protease family)